MAHLRGQERAEIKTDSNVHVMPRRAWVAVRKVQKHAYMAGGQYHV